MAEAYQLATAHPDEIGAYMESILAAHQAQFGTEEMIQIAQGLVGAVPVVGGLLKTGYAVIGKFAGWMGTLLGGSCETKKCCWPRSYSRRNIVGLNPAPMGCYGSADRLFPIPFAFHDGLVVDGPGEIGTADLLGRLRGASPWFHLGSSHADGWLRKNPFYGLPNLPKGDYDHPWRSPRDTYYNRAWRTRSILMWAKDKMPCTHLLCMFKILNGTLNAPQDVFPGGWWSGVQKFDNGKKSAQHNPATDLTRRKGSRWYASLYYFHADLWKMCQLLPVEKVVTEARAVGLHKFADHYEKLMAGHDPGPKYKQMPGWYALKQVGWTNGVQLFQRLLEAQPPAVLHPAFTRARAVMRAVRPQGLRVMPAPLRVARAMHAAQQEELERERQTRTAITLGLAGVAVAVVGASVYFMTRPEE
jgi:hypothetical protein